MSRANSKAQRFIALLGLQMAGLTIKCIYEGLETHIALKTSIFLGLFFMFLSESDSSSLV